MKRNENGTFAKKDNRCDQCEAAMINGVFCHEIGCPNARKIKVDGEWITQERVEE